MYRVQCVALNVEGGQCVPFAFRFGRGGGMNGGNSTSATYIPLETSPLNLFPSASFLNHLSSWLFSVNHLFPSKNFLLVISVPPTPILSPCVGRINVEGVLLYGGIVCSDILCYEYLESCYYFGGVR